MINEDNRVRSPGNIAYLVVALLVSALLLTALIPLSWPLRHLWAKTCFSLLSAFGVDAAVHNLHITIPAISTQFPLSFASPHVGMPLFVETLMGLVLISFFLVRSHWLKWSVFVVSVPVSIPIAVIPVALSVLIGVTFSPNAGLFIYFELLWVLTHLTLALVLAVFGVVAWRKQKTSNQRFQAIENPRRVFSA